VPIIGDDHPAKKRSAYPGKAAHIAPNVVRGLKEGPNSEVLFSDIFEIHLADGSEVQLVEKGEKTWRYCVC